MITPRYVPVPLGTVIRVCMAHIRVPDAFFINKRNAIVMSHIYEESDSLDITAT
ncbi:MAG TPA: hypothetical protein VE130_03690 [Nitrososphaeraceae archaeon]|nr:hypothetical protein [Nitrososphaeraceae archaeon]